MRSPGERHDADLSSTAEDERPVGTCPLCRQASRTIETLAFSPKPHLPDVIRLECCDACDFLFVGGLSADAYRMHYASIRNDEDHVVAWDDPRSDVQAQAARLASALGPDFRGRVLDFGCGQGRLLQALARRYPDATLSGHDVADYLPSHAGIRFVADLDAVERPFDVIVMAHVVEHLVGFDAFRHLVPLLAVGGMLYVEVPDPLHYGACERREHLYYIDRLHINHFGRRAMSRMLARFGLAVNRWGTHRFPYRDGEYPALYCFAGRAAEVVAIAPDDVVGPTLDRAFHDYREHELRRAAATRDALAEAAAHDGVLVHGAGDNFFRARRPGGPLHGIALLAVMDRRASDAGAGDDGALTLPDVALERHPSACVVITVSRDADAIAATIRRRWPDRRIFFA